MVVPSLTVMVSPLSIETAVAPVSPVTLPVTSASVLGDVSAWLARVRMFLISDSMPSMPALAASITFLPVLMPSSTVLSAAARALSADAVK